MYIGAGIAYDSPIKQRRRDEDMSERGIRVDTMDAVWPGMYITQPDDDTRVDDLVDASAYDAGDQDWQHVLDRRGYVDLPTFMTADYRGERTTAKIQSNATVWILVEERNGRFDPVIQKPRD